MNDTVFWSIAIPVFSGLAFITYKHPIVSRKKIIENALVICAVTLGLTYFYCIGVRDEYSNVKDAFNPDDITVGNNALKELNVDSLTRLYKNNKDTIISIMVDDNLETQRELDRQMSQIKAVTNFIKKVTYNYNLEYEKLVRWFWLQKILVIGLVILYLLSYVFEGLWEKSKKID